MDMPQDRETMGRSFTLAVTLFAITLALLFVLQSALFAVSSVQLVGARHLTEEEILSIAGISVGDSLFNVDVRRARERLLAHPRIEQATVRRRLPATIHVEVVERVPVAIMPHPEGFAALDAQGRVLMLSEELRLPYPLLTGFDLPEGSGPEPGTELRSPELNRALTVASALPPSLLATVGEVAATAQGVTLKTRDGIDVLIGDTSQLEEKLQTLSDILRSLADGRESVRQIDVRIPRTPVLR